MAPSVIRATGLSHGNPERAEDFRERFKDHTIDVVDVGCQAARKSLAPALPAAGSMFRARYAGCPFCLTHVSLFHYLKDTIWRGFVKLKLGHIWYAGLPNPHRPNGPIIQGRTPFVKFEVAKGENDSCNV